LDPFWFGPVWLVFFVCSKLISAPSMREWEASEREAEAEEKREEDKSSLHFVSFPFHSIRVFFLFFVSLFPSQLPKISLH
jgi:hypothetical protein